MHTWVGLLLGSILYFMFLTGSAGYFDTEIDRWMRPEHPRPVAITDPVAAFERGIEHARAVAPDADYWFIRIPLTRSYSPYVEVSWSGTLPSGEDYSGRAELDVRTGAPVPPARETGGGQALYLMHYVLHYVPQAWGQWLAGLAALFMFGALLSGIVVHKRFFQDFFTFRPGRNSRSWLDAHNVTSVMTLPYQLMITFSGLVFLTVFYFPLIVGAHYGSGPQGEERFYEEVYGPSVVPERAGVPADLVPVAPLYTAAAARFPGEAMPMLSIHHPGDANARIEMLGDLGASVVRDFPTVTFDGVTGALLDARPRTTTGSVVVMNILEGLHEALFAGPGLRWLFFLSALGGAAMVATGLLLWTAKRRERAARGSEVAAGVELVERLNVGTIAGLPIGIAAYFWANRLLPVGMPDRAAWEMNVLFIVWGLALLHGAVRTPRRHWVEQLCVAALAFGMLPVLNAATTRLHLGRTLPLFGGDGDWALAGFDLACLVLGLLFAMSAWRAAIRRPAPQRPTRRTSVPPIATELEPVQ